ncbi:hypothetical protein B0J13DRAFT_124307 [Dactylonectria estremocensis]|uniref:Uncharacterized protein n=1 Tax=Dactylonectria estremocensis TaxID=1079267 RepID=A0A9P9FDA5_9HYPO|nr:hypothetical protein B0J13DRAFT_124307 [Dactylonectria estremocensis]
MAAHFFAFGLSCLSSLLPSCCSLSLLLRHAAPSYCCHILLPLNITPSHQNSLPRVHITPSSAAIPNPIRKPTPISPGRSSPAPQLALHQENARHLGTYAPPSERGAPKTITYMLSPAAQIRSESLPHHVQLPLCMLPLNPGAHLQVPG